MKLNRFSATIKNNSIIVAIRIRTLEPRAAYQNSRVLHYSSHSQVVIIIYEWQILLSNHILRLMAMA